jgi:hypothetical protein
MLINFDYNASRKMAGLSMRYDSDNNFKTIKQQLFEKAKWFSLNADKLLTNFEMSTNH